MPVVVEPKKISDGIPFKGLAREKIGKRDSELERVRQEKKRE